MGNRILKESICKSDQIDELSWFEETFFYRLLVNCDDYGVMDARPKILKADLFPLKEVTLDVVADALDKLVRVGLVRTYEVDGKPYVQVIKWTDHQRVRDSKHKYPVNNGCENPPQVAASCGELPQTAEKSGSRVQPRAGAESESESISESIINDDDARATQEEHDRVLDAAEDAGFKMSNDVRASLIAMYAQHGLAKVLEGMKSCVKHGAPNLAYLEAVLKAEPKKKPTIRAVPAQGYSQRDYSGEQEDAMRRMIEEYGGAAK